MIKNAKAHGSRYNMQTVSGDALTADLVGNDLWFYDESGPAGESGDCQRDAVERHHAFGRQSPAPEISESLRRPR